MLTKKLFNILKFGLPFFALVAVTLGIYLFNISFNSPSPVYAASCTNCPSGWSSCYNGTMCCWDNYGAGGGCPSYECVKFGGSWNTNLCPQQCEIVSANGNHYCASMAGSKCQQCGGGGGGGGCVECKKNCPTSNQQGSCGTGSDGAAKYWCKVSCEEPTTLKCNSTREVSCKKTCTGKKGSECDVSKNGTVSYECLTYKCYQSNVGKPTTSGASGTYDQDSALDIVFKWKLTNWGNTCKEPCNVAGFKLFVDGKVIKEYNKATTEEVQYGRSPSSFSVGTHSWYVQSYRTGSGTANSVTRQFKITSPDVAVQGYIWDATGQACSANPSSLEIPSSGVTVSVDGTQSAAVDQDSGTAYTFRVGNVSPGGHYLAVDNLPTPPGSSETSYQLACVNGVESGAANFSASSDPTTVNLGYRPISTVAWTQAFNGNIHTNNILSYLRPPASGEFHGQFLISARGDIGAQVLSEPGWLASLYPQGNLSVFDNSAIPSPTYNQIRSLYGRGAAASATIPSAGTLINGGLYRVTQSDVLNGVYNVPSGVKSLIFVDGTLTINAEIRTPTNSYIAFIARDGINIDKQLAGGGGGQDVIEATLITEGAINTAYNRTDENEIHRQLLVEGNLISLTNTLFLYRNLGEDENIDNPAEVVSPRISSFIRAKNVLGKPRIFWREIPAGN